MCKHTNQCFIKMLIVYHEPTVSSVKPGTCMSNSMQQQQQQPRLFTIGILTSVDPDDPMQPPFNVETPTDVQSVA